MFHYFYFFKKTNHVMKKLNTLKKISVQAKWTRNGFAYNKTFDPNPFRTKKELKAYLLKDGLEKNEEYYVDEADIHECL